MKIPVLKIKDKDGNLIPINAIRGENGKSAYEQAKEGGYTGTLEEFIALLNGFQTSDGGGAVGYNASSDKGGAVGLGAKTFSGGAVGWSATSGYGFAGGALASTTKIIADGEEEVVENAIQLGVGMNSEEKTLQVFNYRLMDANGVIPVGRLPKPSGSYTGTGSTANQSISIGGEGRVLLVTSSNGDIAFVYENGAYCFPRSISANYVTSEYASFVGGVLTLTNNTFPGLNALSVTHYYQVL